jgi:signal transduction histidine kinase
MSRMLAGKLRLDVQPVETATFIQAALDTVSPAASAKGLSVQPPAFLGSASISGDPSRLHQVMTNLLSNAIKFTPRGGIVHVLLKRVGPQIEIRVADSGIGVEPGFHPAPVRAFSPSRCAPSPAGRTRNLACPSSSSSSNCAAEP